MIIKLQLHVMPWEIDYAQIIFSKLKAAHYYLSDDITIEFDCVLNLSSYIIDWEKSNIKKEFFISKFNQIRKLMEWSKINRYEVIETDKLYGHLDLNKESISDNVDGYLNMCPDINFNENTFILLCENAKLIKDRFFVLTTEIYKKWDVTWDCIVNEKYKDVPYSEWNKGDSFSIGVDSNLNVDTSFIYKLKGYKFAGWFEYYSKDFINKLFVFPDEWSGYGPWDLYCLLSLFEIARNNIKIDISQYVLKNQMVQHYDNETFKGGFSVYYKENLCLKKIENQRKVIENRLNKDITNLLNRISAGELQ